MGMDNEHTDDVPTNSSMITIMLDPAVGSSEKKTHWKKKTFLLIMVPFTFFIICLTASLLFAGKMNRRTVAWVQGGWFALLATWLSVFCIMMHFTTWTKPELQRRIVRILFMVPIYAVDSWLGLFIPAMSPDAHKVPIFFNLIRDCYESYVLYQFFSYIIELLGGWEEAAIKLGEVRGIGPEVGTMTHKFPLCRMKPIKLGMGYLNKTNFCILQYMIVKPFCTVLAIILMFSGVYEEGHFTGHNAYPYISIIVNISVTFAFGAVYYFYLCTHELLKEHRLLPKFACVKAVIFLSFWQSVAVAALATFTEIFECTDCHRYTSTLIADSVQEYLICLEMFLIALAHRWAFSHNPFVDGKRGKVNFRAVESVIRQDDVATAVGKEAERVHVVLVERVRDPVSEKLKTLLPSKTKTSDQVVLSLESTSYGGL